MIISNIICNRWVGHEFGDWRGSIDRWVCPLVIASEAYLWSIFNWQVALLAGVAFAIWRYDGWGEVNLAMHGKLEHYKNRNTTKLITKIADSYKPTNVAKRKIYGIIWGGLRGLYDFPAFIALHFFVSGPVLFGYIPLIPLIGALMALQGVVYFLVGSYIKQDTAHCELAMGAFRGVLWMGALYV